MEELPVEDSSKCESLGAEGLRLSPWQTAPPFTDGKAEVMLLNLAGSLRSAAGEILLQLSHKLFWNAESMLLFSVLFFKYKSLSEL